MDTRGAPALDLRQSETVEKLRASAWLTRLAMGCRRRRRPTAALWSGKQTEQRKAFCGSASWRFNKTASASATAGSAASCPATVFAIVAATGNIYSGLWYPIAVAAMSFVVAVIFLPETKDRDITRI